MYPRSGFEGGGICAWVDLIQSGFMDSRFLHNLYRQLQVIYVQKPLRILIGENVGSYGSAEF